MDQRDYLIINYAPVKYVLIIHTRWWLASAKLAFHKRTFLVVYFDNNNQHPAALHAGFFPSHSDAKRRCYLCDQFDIEAPIASKVITS